MEMLTVPDKLTEDSAMISERSWKGIRALSQFIFVFLGTAICFELLNRFLVPHVTSWQTHVLVIGLLLVSAGAPYLAHSKRGLRRFKDRAPTRRTQEKSAFPATVYFLPKDANLLDALIQMSPVAIAVADQNHKIGLINPAFTEIFGYALEECIGRTTNELIVPADAEAGFQQNAQLVMGGTIVRGTMKRKRKDGTIVYVESYAVPVSAKGKTSGVVAVYQDVTKRVLAEAALRQSEEIFRMLSATAPVGIFRTDENGIPVYVNERLTEITGVTLEQSCASRWSDSIHPEDRERTLSLWFHAIQTDEELIDQHRVVKPSGEVIWVSMRARWAKGSDGRPQSFVGVIEDVTVLRQAAEEMRLAKDVAEAASRAKGEFLANMSHEIRTPLNGILGMTDLALDTDLSAEQREFLDTVKFSADSLLIVINDILDFSKIEAGKLDLEAVDFNLRDCLESTLKTLVLRAGEKGVELLCDIADNVPEIVRGDATRLRQIMLNLLGNAIKFTSKGEVELKAEMGNERAGVRPLHFTVRDTGIGIAFEKQKLIFDPFSQADTSTTRKYGGTGLGLTISARLVTLMKGEIWLKSDVGRGTEFHFTAWMPAGNTKPSQVPPGTFPETLRGVKVLIVDDNLTNRRILMGMLARWEMNPVAVESAEQALGELSAAWESGKPYAMVLTDLLMPQMDGFELIERIRERSELSAATIVMLTSAGQRGDAARCEDLRVSAYLMKPIRQSELRDAIGRVLGAHPEDGAVPLITRFSIGQAHDPAASLKILLAEDNAVNQRVATRLLEKRGHNVMVAANGRQALDMLAKQGFDLVFMDVQMPEMDGFEATAEIRKSERLTGLHQPVIAMTAHAMKGDRERCLLAGMDSYLAKPIRIDELDLILDTYVANRTFPKC